MATTQNTYTGDGSTVLFSFTFPYLETTDIKVSLDGTTTNAYTLANATTIQFNTAPANGVAIRIYRQTDDADLAATFYPGSAIRSQDLNDNFTQNLYVTQESSNNAATATTTAEGAVTTANSALSTANAASATATSAASDAATAVSTANTASTNASNAVTTANTASTNASNAVTTANSAASDAATALSTANSAASDAATAISTANSAASDASTALSTANSASSTATSAASDAATALSTANTASTNASNAVTTANSADSKADTAITAVANALLYSIVANVAAIPGSPSNNDAIEVSNSTGIESFTPLANIPAGFVGDSGLSVRIVYDSASTSWEWIQYFPNDPDSRYAGPNTSVGSASSPSIAFGPTDPDTGLFSPGADELALVTGGVARLTFDSVGQATFNNAVTLPAGSTVSGYLDNTSASSTYQTIAGMSSYVASTDIGVTVQPYDANLPLGNTILVDSDIGSTVQAYDATLPAGSTILVDSDVGTTVQPYDANLPTGSTILVDSDIGTTVQPYNATYLEDADIGVSVQPYDSNTAKLNVAQTFTAIQTLTDPAIIGAIKEDIYTISDGAAFEIDPGNGSIQLITLGASRTPKATNFAAGEAVTLMVNDGTAYTLTWTDATFGGSGVVWKTDSGSAPTLNTSGYTVIVLWKVGSQVYGARVGDA